MTLADILLEIRRSLKEPSAGGHWADSELIRRLNIGQKKVVRLTSCMEATWEAVTVAAQASYSKPVACLRVLRGYYENSGNRLFPTNTADLDMASATGKIANPWSGIIGTPTNYYETMRNVWLYPIPDTAGVTFGVEGIIRPDDLVETTDVPFNDEPYMADYHDILISFVLWRCFLEDEKDAFKVHKQDFVDGLNSIMQDMKKKPDSLGTFDLIRSNSRSGKGPLPGIQI